eukprot:5595810-Prymnesium_polylepis.2
MPLNAGNASGTARSTHLAQSTAADQRSSLRYAHTIKTGQPPMQSHIEAARANVVGLLCCNRMARTREGALLLQTSAKRKFLACVVAAAG